MDNKVIKEALNELLSSLEALETQSTAILQFLKEKRRVTDKQLAPYLEQAGKASDVKWRAARIRIEHLFAAAEREEERAAEKQRSAKAQASRETLVEYMQQGSDKTSDRKDAEQPAREGSAHASKAQKTEPRSANKPGAPQPNADAAATGDASIPERRQAEHEERNESPKKQSSSTPDEPAKKDAA
jgi:colicin import membrane protein